MVHHCPFLNTSAAKETQVHIFLVMDLSFLVPHLQHLCISAVRLGHNIQNQMLLLYAEMCACSICVIKMPSLVRGKENKSCYVHKNSAEVNFEHGPVLLIEELP